MPSDPFYSFRELVDALEDQPRSSEDAAAWLLTLGEKDRLTTLGRWAAELDRLNEEIRNLLPTIGSYRRLAQEEIVVERDALADRIAHCCQVLADLPGPEPEPGCGPVRTKSQREK
jgi:hypothetical protein